MFIYNSTHASLVTYSSPLALVFAVVAGCRSRAPRLPCRVITAGPRRFLRSSSVPLTLCSLSVRSQDEPTYDAIERAIPFGRQVGCCVCAFFLRELSQLRVPVLRAGRTRRVCNWTNVYWQAKLLTQGKFTRRNVPQSPAATTYASSVLRRWVRSQPYTGSVTNPILRILPRVSNTPRV